MSDFWRNVRDSASRVQSGPWWMRAGITISARYFETYEAEVGGKTMKTVERLRELLAASEAVSPGPWVHKVERNNDGTTSQAIVEANSELVVPDVPEPVEAKLIVAMRNALPALLDVVEAAEGVRRLVAEDINSRCVDGKETPSAPWPEEATMADTLEKLEAINDD